MARRQRTSEATRSKTGGADAGTVVFLPCEVELELLGVIGPAGKLPDSDAVERVYLDDEESFALVESLRLNGLVPPSFGLEDFAGAGGDPPTN